MFKGKNGNMSSVTGWLAVFEPYRGVHKVYVFFPGCKAGFKEQQQSFLGYGHGSVHVKHSWNWVENIVHICLLFVFSNKEFWPTAMYVHDTNPVSDGCLVFWFDTSHSGNFKAYALPWDILGASPTITAWPIFNYKWSFLVLGWFPISCSLNNLCNWNWDCCSITHPAVHKFQST